MQRYFINTQDIVNETVQIVGNDFHHIKNVMRMKLGDKILVCDQINTYLCIITAINEKVILKIISKIETYPELKWQVTVAHGVVRREKTEEVIRRLVELGCFQYLPVMMERSIVKINGDKTERQLKIIKEASEQSQRLKLMKISEPLSFKDLLTSFENYDLVTFCHFENNVSYQHLLKKFAGTKILTIIGPEGGFSEREIGLLQKANAQAVSLGQRILRTETAPLCAMSILAYEAENEN